MYIWISWCRKLNKPSESEHTRNRRDASRQNHPFQNSVPDRQLTIPPEFAALRDPSEQGTGISHANGVRQEVCNRRNLP